MKRWQRVCMGIGSIFHLMAGIVLAEDLPRVAIVNSPGDPLRQAETARAIEALRQAGFVDQQTMRLTIFTEETPEENAERIRAMQPAVVLDIGNNNARDNVAPLLRDTDLPIIYQYLAPDHPSQSHITGVYSFLPDMIYNSYKFLRLIAPPQPGQKSVFFENTLSPIFRREEVADAMQRLGVPLKTVYDTALFEDWQHAIETVNADPEVAWVIHGVWPTFRRDGSKVDMEHEVAPWHRTYLKKAMVTQYDIAVQWGVLAAFGIDLPEVGFQCGEMAARVLKGEDINTIKAEYPRKTLVALNRKTADAMGIIFPPDVLNLANVIYHDWDGKEVTRKSGLK